MSRVKETLQHSLNTRKSRRAHEELEINGGLFLWEVGNNPCPAGVAGCPVCPGRDDLGVLFLPELFGPWFPHPYVLLPVLLQFLQGFARIGWTLVSGIHVGFVYDYQGLFYVVLHSRLLRHRCAWLPNPWVIRLK